MILKGYTDLTGRIFRWNLPERARPATRTVRWIREDRYEATGFTASTDVIPSKSVVRVALIQDKQYWLAVMKRSEKLNSLADLLSRDFREIMGSKCSLWRK